MKPYAEDERGTGWVFLLVFVVFAVGVIASGVVVYRNYEHSYRAEVERQLSAVAELKVRELAQWRRARLGDGRIFFRNEAFSDAVRRVSAAPEDADARRHLQAWVRGVLQSGHYDRARLLDPRGATLFAIPSDLPPVSGIVSNRLPEVLNSGQVTVQDFYRCEHDQRPYLSLMVPVLDPESGSQPLGVLVLRVDPESYLYPYLKRWPTPSLTAETLLVRREGNETAFLNELRFQTNTALRLRMPLDRPLLPAALAALGREGVIDGTDYRGVPVVAALRTVPDSPWFLVARMDADEVYRPLRERLWIVIAMVALLLRADAS
ncbi:MAG: cache domain-containing protein [Verrucomicrobia bacterium]|nr:cache domain-containing protein [Verrucomicrobiota bacterium]